MMIENNTVQLSMREVYKVSKRVLELTPETWLEFSAGQNTKTNLARFKSNKYISLVKQIMGYFYFFFKSFGLKSTAIGRSDVLFFAASNNQFSVLRPIFSVDSEFSSVFVVPNFWCSHFDVRGVKPYATKISISFFFLVFMLTISRLFVLLKTLWSTDSRLVFLRLKSFLLVYYWLVAHQIILKDVRPQIVMLSNDHNSETRTMIELCKYFGIKTAYVPHAGVSKRFHSLDFNYSFLDGQHALDIYQSCDNRRSPKSKVISKRLCFMVGNLRKLDIDKSKGKPEGKFGLAIKGTDRLEDVVNIIEQLVPLSRVVVRPHPSLKSSRYYQIIEEKFSHGVEFSDPRTQSASEFLAGLTTLISGNSTLLLEAAAAGKNPVYLNELSDGVYDYYGFVERKIADYFETIKDFINFYVGQDSVYFFSPDSDGMSYYWSSFGQDYSDKEAQIISNYLSQIVSKAPKFHSRYQIKIQVM